MAYRHSDIERANLKWFANDTTRASLKSIELRKGTLRGLKPFELTLQYPVSAIAGKNGCGKSSILAMAACAFHSTSGWKLPDRKLPYYTFSDFFLQATGDAPLEGLEIWYGILHNHWKPTTELPQGVGLGLQLRKKGKGGKWNDYDRRVKRPVAFFGIERVVPPSERSIYRNYRSYFVGKKAKAGWEDTTRESVARVLGQPYEDFEVYSHTKYRLPLVSCRGSKYSGLNMGAGEKALFELIGAFWACPEGTLLLIDELELGLHESAQRALVRELSQICEKKKVQVICTTHSPIILKSLPPEGRFLVFPGAKQTHVTPGVTPAYAAGRLGEHHSSEATLYVEDGAAATLISSYMSRDLLGRVRIVPIGSHTAVVAQLASRYLDLGDEATVAILDGDQLPAAEAHLKRFKGLVGNLPAKDEQWAKDRLAFLPGGDSPERWVLGKIRNLDLDVLAQHFRVPEGAVVRDAMDAALVANDHSEMHALAKALNDTPDALWRDACSLMAASFQNEFSDIKNLLLKHLKE